MGKVRWVHVRQKVEPSFVAGVGVTVARARSFTPVLFLSADSLPPSLLAFASLLPRSLHDSPRRTAPSFPVLLGHSRAILPPAAGRVQILPTFLFLPPPLPYPISPSLLSSLFSFSPENLFSPVFFTLFLPLDRRAHSHPVQHLPQLYTPPTPPLCLSFSLLLSS